MGRHASDGERTGGVRGAGAEAETGPPENCAIPLVSVSTPVKLLGQSDGAIEFDACIENANVQDCRQNITYNKGKCLRDDDIMRALEIKMFHSANEEPTNPIAECSKEDTSSIQGSIEGKTKMNIRSFVTPVLKENHKRDNASLPQLDEGAMKCQVLESNAVGLDARVKGGVINPSELENNVRVYNVEMAAYGNYKGHGLPLAYLMSKSTRRHIKGYPVTMEALEDCCPAPSTEVHCPAVSCFNCLMESRISVPRQARSLRKPSGSRKVLEHDLDKSLGRSTLRFSSCCNSSRERSNRKPEVTEDFPPPICSATKLASSPRQTRSFLSFAKMLQVRVVKGSPQTSHSPPVDAMDDSESNADDCQSDSSADGYCSASSAVDNYVRKTNHFAGSHGSPSFPSPVSTSPRSINGYTALYLCSASTLCAPVHLV